MIAAFLAGAACGCVGTIILAAVALGWAEYYRVRRRSGAGK